MGKLEGYKYITYLIGAMERTAEGDDGGSKREILQKELLDRAVYPINPVQLEKYKVNFSTDEAKTKMNTWLEDKKYSEFKDFSRSIWKGKYLLDKKYGLIHIPGDIDYVIMSDWITCAYNKGDHICIEKNSQITMSDFTTKAIKDIKKGDEILGWKKLYRRTILVKSVVLAKYKKGKQKCIEVKDTKENNIICTPEHKFLTRSSKQVEYRKIKNIHNVFSVKFKKFTRDYIKGWVMGYLMNDGCFRSNKTTNEVTCISDKRSEMEVVKKTLEGFGFNPTIRKVRHLFLVAINRKAEYNKLKKWKDTPEDKYSIDMKRGYLSGAIDADGYYEKFSLRYTQSLVHPLNIKRFETFCDDLKIKYSKQVRAPRDTYIGKRKLNGKGEVCIVLPKKIVFYIPSRLEYKRKNINMSINNLKSNITKKETKDCEVYDLVTTTGNFMANGFIVHNCGTVGEAFMAFEHNIPVYLITDITEEEEKTLMAKSFLQCIYGSGGYIFRDIGDYLNFIENKYLL